jgi:Flp pilus assembly protein TadG
MSPRDRAALSRIGTIRRVGRRRDRHDERGVVLVWMAMCLVGMLMFAGLMVDLGAWYQQSQDIQRTADAAALAGATYLPGSPGTGGPATLATSGCPANLATTGKPTDAFCAAMKVVAKNGYSNATLHTWVDGSNDRQLDVQLTQGNIQQYFTSFFMGPLTFARSSQAQFSQPIDLGSPQNYFGTGTLYGFTGFGTGNTPNFWGSIAGYCEAKEAGDEYASGFDGNVGNVHNGSYVLGGSFPTSCNPSADTGRIGTSTPTCNTGQQMNCEFDPLGYEYTVTVPTGLSNVHLYVFNARFDPCSNQPVYDASHKLVPAPSPPYTSPMMDADSNLSAQYPCGGSVPPGATKINTYFTLAGAGGPVGTGQYVATTTHAAGYPAWTDLTGKLGTTLSPGTYYLNISTIKVTDSAGVLTSTPAAADAGPSFGVHNYGILVSTNGTTPSGNLNNGGTYVCTSPPAVACPTVFANTSTAEAVTIVSTGGTSAATAYLANVPTAAIGKVVTLKIWDPGDFAQYIQIMKPDGTPLGAAVGDPTISYAVYGADPNTAAQYGGTIPNPNNTAAASGTLSGCQDYTGTTFAGSSGPCLPVDGCTPLNAWSTGSTTPLMDCNTALASIGTPSWGAPNNRFGPSRYSDALVELSFVAPVAGWYGISEVTSQPQVHDTITLNLLINGLPPHLTP